MYYLFKRKSDYGRLVIIMDDKENYSVEELTKMLTEANERIRSQENKITSLNTQIDSLNTRLSDEAEHVKKLQKANLELYMRVPVNQTENKEKGDDPKVSRKARRESTDWNSIINKF